MSLFAAIHIAETQQRLADLRLKSVSDQQDALLKDKEHASLLMDLLNQYRGKECSADQMQQMKNLGKEWGIDVSSLDGAASFDANGHKAYFMWVPTNDGDRKNREAFDGA